MFNNKNIVVSDDTSNSEDNTYPSDSDESYLDEPEIARIPDCDFKIQYINDVALALVDAGMRKADLLTWLTISDLKDEMEGKFPRKHDEFLEFADTVDQLAIRSPAERIRLVTALKLAETNYIDDVAGIMHGLRLTGSVIMDPKLGRAYTVSPVFARFFEVTQDRLEINSISRAALKYMIKSIKSVFNDRKEVEISAVLKDSQFALASVEMFYNARLVPKSIMIRKSVVNGVAKSSIPLPFLVPQNKYVSTSEVRNVILSQALQDMIGAVPVSISPKAKCSTSVEHYQSNYWDGEGFVPKTYIKPIVLAPEGLVGDSKTTNITDEGKFPEMVDYGLRWFADSDKFEMTDTNFCVPKPMKGLLEKYDYSDYSDYHTKLWDTVLKTPKRVKVGDYSFIHMPPKKLIYTEFVKWGGVAVVDYSTYNQVFESAKSVFRQYVFIVVSVTSQTILAIPSKWINNPVINENMSNPSSLWNVRHPQYMILWHNIAKKMPRAGSCFFTACVLTMHSHNGALALHRRQAFDLYKIGMTKRKGSGTKDGTLMFTDKMESLFDFFWKSEVESPNVMVFVSAGKSSSEIASDALTALFEVDIGLVVEEDDDTIPDEEDEVIFHDEGLFSTARTVNSKVRSKKSKLTRKTKKKKKVDLPNVVENVEDQQSSDEGVSSLSVND